MKTENNWSRYLRITVWAYIDRDTYASPCGPTLIEILTHHRVGLHCRPWSLCVHRRQRSSQSYPHHHGYLYSQAAYPASLVCPSRQPVAVHAAQNWIFYVYKLISIINDHHLKIGHVQWTPSSGDTMRRGHSQIKVRFLKMVSVLPQC